MVNREQLKKLVKNESTYRVVGTNVMLAVLVLHTGFVVTGQSGCVDPEDFKVERGRELALKEAYGKLAECEAYLALEDMHDDGKLKVWVDDVDSIPPLPPQKLTTPGCPMRWIVNLRG